MKKILSLLLAVVLLFGAVSAEDLQPAAKSGAKSLNFTFGGLGVFGLGASGLSGINPNFAPGFGASYFLSNDAAVRIGLQVALPSMTTPANLPANPPAGVTGVDATASAVSLGIGADYLMYTYATSARVRPFVGAGLYFITNSTTDKDGNGTNGAPVANFVQTETKNRIGGININGRNYQAGSSFGLQAIVGAEFFIYNEVSVSAEYDLNLFNTTTASDQVQTTGPTSTTTKSPSFTTILGFGAAGATLHIYF